MSNYKFGFAYTGKAEDTSKVAKALHTALTGNHDYISSSIMVSYIHTHSSVEVYIWPQELKGVIPDFSEGLSFVRNILQQGDTGGVIMTFTEKRNACNEAIDSAKTPEDILKALKLIKEYFHDDGEMAHILADDALNQAVVILGHPELSVAWAESSEHFWYA